MSAPSPFRGTKAVAVVGFLTMAIVGWKLGGPPRNAADAPGRGEQQPVKPNTQRERNARLHGPPEHVRERMRAIRAAGSSGERLRATIELANSLPVSDMAAWMEGRWFDVGGGFEATLFKKIAMQRWMEEDPEGHAIWSMKNGGGTAILATWAKEDPQRLLAFFQNHPNQEQEIRALQTLAANHPGVALARLTEILGKGSNPRGGSSSHYIQSVLTELGKKDPAALEAAMESVPAQWRYAFENVLVSQRLKSDFAGEIRNLWERPDGFRLFQASDYNVRNKLIDELGNVPASWKASIASSYYNFVNSDSAEKWLNADLESHGFTAEQVKSIKGYSLTYVADRKPKLAIQQMNAMDLDDSERQNLISNIFSSHPNRSPEFTESLIAELGSEQDRQAARAQLEGALVNSSDSSQAKIEKPSDWLEKAASLDPNHGSNHQLLSLLGGWDKDKLAELSQGFRSLPDEQKTQVATLIARNHWSSDGMEPSLRGEAIRHLVGNPPTAKNPDTSTDPPLQLASTHAVFWANKDPDAASAWVQTLPAGEAKLWAQKNLAANWALYDPDAAGQWVKSLPGEARGEVEKFMMKDGE